MQYNITKWSYSGGAGNASWNESSKDNNLTRKSFKLTSVLYAKFKVNDIPFNKYTLRNPPLSDICTGYNDYHTYCK